VLVIWPERALPLWVLERQLKQAMTAAIALGIATVTMWRRLLVARLVDAETQMITTTGMMTVMMNALEVVVMMIRDTILGQTMVAGRVQDAEMLRLIFRR